MDHPVDDVLSINPSANVFVFGDFNIHHKDWLTYFGETDGSGKLCYNFSISNDLTQMVNFSTQIPDCDSHSLALLDLLLSSDASICSTIAFPPLGNSDQVFVSVSIDFPSYLQQDPPFHRIAHDYSRVDWDGVCDHLRNLLSEDILKLSASTASSEFCEWVQVVIVVYIPQESGSQDFWLISNSVFSKGKSAKPFLFNSPEVLASPSDKAKLFADNFCKNSNLDDSGICLTVFLSRNNLKSHISLTTEVVKKVIIILEFSKASGPDCIPVVVLKNFEPEVSYILAELFNASLKESRFPDS